MKTSSSPLLAGLAQIALSQLAAGGYLSAQQLVALSAAPAAARRQPAQRAATCATAATVCCA